MGLVPRMFHAIAQSVASELSALPEIPINAVAYRHMHEWDIDKLRTLRIAISPRGADAQNVSRSGVACDYRIGISIAKYVQSNADADEVFGVSEAVLEKLKDRVVLDLPGSDGRVAFLSATLDFSAEDALSEQSVYRGNIEATYKVLP